MFLKIWPIVFYIYKCFVSLQGGKPGKKKAVAFPSLEGEETVEEFVGKYKRQCISRKSLYRELLERFETEKPVSGKTLWVQ